jgi:FADH2-dependent halogenase
MELYWDMIEGFYTKPFMELFLEPRPRYQLPDAIVAILAGELDGGWKLAWRRRIFFWLVKCQRKLPIVPNVSFAENDLASPR